MKTKIQRDKRKKIRKENRKTKVDLLNEKSISNAKAIGAKSYFFLHPTKGFRKKSV